MSNAENYSAESATDQPTMGEAAIEIGKQIKSSVLEAPDPTKIDWTNIRALIAKFLEAFGPIIIPLIVSWLTPKPAEEKI